jgi:hypothetical protein
MHRYEVIVLRMLSVIMCSELLQHSQFLQCGVQVQAIYPSRISHHVFEACCVHPHTVNLFEQDTQQLRDQSQQVALISAM